MSTKERLYSKVGIAWNPGDPTCPDENCFCLLGIEEDAGDTDVIAWTQNALNERIKLIKRYAHIDRKESGSSGLPKRLKDAHAILSDASGLRRHRNELWQKRMSLLIFEAEQLSRSNALESTAKNFLLTKSESFGFPSESLGKAVDEAINNVPDSFQQGQPAPKPRQRPRQTPVPSGNRGLEELESAIWKANKVAADPPLEPMIYVYTLGGPTILTIISFLIWGFFSTIVVAIIVYFFGFMILGFRMQSEGRRLVDAHHRNNIMTLAEDTGVSERELSDRIEREHSDLFEIW
jgi:hypothetical protein